MPAPTRRLCAATLLLGGALWAQSAQAACYCQQGHIHGNQCIAPAGPNNSIVPIGTPICPAGATPMKPERRPPSAEEMRRLNEQVAEINRNNPQGCTAPRQDGLAFCWDYSEAKSGNETKFRYEDPRYSRYSTHGLSYLYDNGTGRLKEIQIYDRGSLPKGENAYAFHKDGSVTVVDFKRTDDTENIGLSKISVAEALTRLGLPQTVLHLPIRPDSRVLSAMQAQLPAGCPKHRAFSKTCSIKTLHR